MKPWHEGLLETMLFVGFPPLGQERAFAPLKERISAHLRQAFAGLEFELADAGLYEDASVMPMCGAVGDESSCILAQPPEGRLREIEDVLNEFDLARTGLS